MEAEMADSGPQLVTSSDLTALRERQVMEALKLSRNTVRRLRLSGQLASFRVGRTVLYPSTAVAAFIRERSLAAEVAQ
jgi:hypothetical protein